MNVRAVPKIPPAAPDDTGILGKNGASPISLPKRHRIAWFPGVSTRTFARFIGYGCRFQFLCEANEFLPRLGIDRARG
jgi:hypothetical protein